MITEVSDYIVYELAELKGENVKFCRYEYYDSDFNEGFVLVSDYNSFFIRVETKIVDEKHDVHFLIIKAFQNIEIDEAFSFTTITEGLLSDVTFMKSTVSGMVINSQIIQDITTESSLLIEFDDERRILIHPDEQLFSSTGYTCHMDDILDVMNDKRLGKSRQAIKDINLLQCWQ